MASGTLAQYGGQGNLGSGGGATRLSPDLDHLTDADDLAEVAFDEVDFVFRHGFHRDLDMHHVAGAMRPHAVGHQVAFGERLQHTGEQAGRALGVEQESYMGGHWSKLQVTWAKKRGNPGCSDSRAA